MFIKLLRKRGQSVAEYAILIGIVIGAIIAMQTWIGRRMRGRMYDAAQYQPTGFNNSIFHTDQYEPIGIDSSFVTNRVQTSSEARAANAEIQRTGISETTTRVGTITFNR